MPVLVDSALPPGSLRHLTQPRLDLGGGFLARPWLYGDASFLQRTFLDPDIQKWHVRRIDSDDEARDWLAGWAHRWEQETDASWAIARTETDEAIGQVGFRDVRLGEARAQMSYWVDVDARGQGTASRAAAAVAGWGMTVLGLQRVGLAHAVSNLGSCRVAQRAGFAYEGTLRRYGLHADGWHDMHMHARTADVRPLSQP